MLVQPDRNATKYHGMSRPACNGSDSTTPQRAVATDVHRDGEREAQAGGATDPFQAFPRKKSGERKKEATRTGQSQPSNAVSMVTGTDSKCYLPEVCHSKFHA